MKKIYISLTIICFLVFVFLFSIQNLHIKIWQYEYVTFAFDKNKNINLNKIIEHDKNILENKKIDIYFWKYFHTKDSIKEIGWKLELVTDLSIVKQLDNKKIINYIITKEKIYINELKYNLIFDKEKLQNYFITKLENNKIKDINIQNFYFTNRNWLVWLLSDKPNVIQKQNNEKFYFELNEKNIIINSNDFEKLNIYTNNEIEKFILDYESKLFNINSDVNLIIKDKNIKKIFNENISLFNVNSTNIEYFLEIFNNKNVYFKLNEDFNKKIISEITNNFQNLEFLPIYDIKTKFINNEFTIIKNKLINVSWKNLIVNEKIFSTINIFLKNKLTTEKVKYKNNKTFKLEGSEFLCNTLDWIWYEKNISKKINFEILKNDKIKNINDFNKYIEENKFELNEELNYLTKILLFLENPIINVNSSINSIEWYKSVKFYALNSPIGDYNIDFFDNSNKIEISKNRDDFLINCKKIDNEFIEVTIWYNKKGNSNLFWPVLIDDFEKWTIISKWIETIFKTKK